MRPSLTSSTSRTRAGVRTVLVVGMTLIVGFGGGAWVAYRASRPPPADVVETGQPVLSDGTKSVLNQLSGPVTVHFYALFGGEHPPEKWRAFASQINGLLSAMEAAAPGKIAVTRMETWNPANTKAAAADGLTSTDLGGDPSYLSLTFSQERRKEILGPLAPEWASALEADLARALARVGIAPPVVRSPEAVTQAVEAEAAVRQTIPDATSVSLEEGKQRLRAAALKKFADAVAALNSEIAQAEAELERLSPTNQPAAHQAALQQVQAIRARNGEKLRELALQAQAEMEAWTKQKGP